MKLSPSILAADFAVLGACCRTVLDAGADMIHYDVMDGHFVENLSFGLPVLQSLDKALPDAVFDVHLMITNPRRYVKAFAEAGADYLTFHVEAEDSIPDTIRAIRAAGCKAGLSCSPDTPVEAMLPWLSQIDLALVMGVQPGQGRQTFLPESERKIAAIRAERDRLGLALEISVDGGVNLATTGPLCKAAGADILVSGSAVFNAPDVAAAVRAFRAL
ncbi:MAG: ribulose-phosphate 3-epimerase [Clostridiales bacterium]|nr:ribulose-phosphate 3-epimerase [Clostridiales bacterium]